MYRSLTTREKDNSGRHERWWIHWYCMKQRHVLLSTTCPIYCILHGSTWLLLWICDVMLKRVDCRRMTKMCTRCDTNLPRPAAISTLTSSIMSPLSLITRDVFSAVKCSRCASWTVMSRLRTRWNVIDVTSSMRNETIDRKYKSVSDQRFMTESNNGVCIELFVLKMPTIPRREICCGKNYYNNKSKEGCDCRYFV